MFFKTAELWRWDRTDVEPLSLIVHFYGQNVVPDADGDVDFFAWVTFMGVPNGVGH
jgi:hypothetical protein